MWGREVMQQQKHQSVKLRLLKGRLLPLNFTMIKKK
jgi:hypothetical protein